MARFEPPKSLGTPKFMPITIAIAVEERCNRTAQGRGGVVDNLVPEHVADVTLRSRGSDEELKASCDMSVCRVWRPEMPRSIAASTAAVPSTKIAGIRQKRRCRAGSSALTAD